MPKLTKRVVDSIKPRADADVFVWDDELPGFGLRVKPAGTKAFIVQYRNDSGRSRRMTIGRYGVLTVEQGKHKGRLALAEVLHGKDPASKKSADRSAMTVGDLCREYLDLSARGLIITRRKQPKKPATLQTDRSQVERHVIPLLGKLKVRSLTAADLRAFLRDVTAGKTKADVKTKSRGRAIVTGGAGTARRSMALLGAILTYAVGEGYRPDNPARGIALPAGGQRLKRLDAREYATLGAALRTAEQNGGSWQGILAIRLLALTGCRRGEVIGLTKGEVESMYQMLRLRDTKTGASVRPVGRAALEIIRQAETYASGDNLFSSSSQKPQPYAGLPKFWKRVVTPVLPGVTPHTLRHSFASVADDLNFTEATIGAMLGHTGRGTTRKYVHKLDAALIAAANRVSDAIAMMMSGQAAEIVDLLDQSVEHGT